MPVDGLDVVFDDLVEGVVDSVLTSFYLVLVVESTHLLRLDLHWNVGNDPLEKLPCYYQVVLSSCRTRPYHKLSYWLCGHPVDSLRYSNILEFGVVDKSEFGSCSDLLLNL